MRPDRCSTPPRSFAFLAFAGLVLVALASVLAYRPASTFAARHFRPAFDGAWDEASANSSLPQGAAYLRAIQPNLAAAQTAFAGCVSASRTLRPGTCRVVIFLGATGTISETRIDQAGALGSCAAAASLRLRLPPPPRPGWSIGFTLTPASSMPHTSTALRGPA